MQAGRLLNVKVGALSQPGARPLLSFLPRIFACQSVCVRSRFHAISDPNVSNPATSSGIRDNHKRGFVADFLKAKIQIGSRLSIVSAYFTIYAYDALKDHLDAIEHLGFLFGEPSFVNRLDPSKTEKKPSSSTRLDWSYPWVLGDNYDELVESLSRLADAGLSLHIASRKDWPSRN